MTHGTSWDIDTPWFGIYITSVQPLSNLFFFKDITQITLLYSCLKKCIHLTSFQWRTSPGTNRSLHGLGSVDLGFHVIESSVSQPSQCITIIKSYQDISSPMVFQTYLRSGQGHYLESPWFLVMIAVDDSNVSTSNLWRLESFIPTSGQQNTSLQGLHDLKLRPRWIGTKGLVFPGALTSFIDTGKTSFKTTSLYFPLSQYGENRHFLLLSFENWRTQKARWILLPSPSCWIAISHDFTHHLYQASVFESSAFILRNAKQRDSSNVQASCNLASFGCCSCKGHERTSPTHKLTSHFISLLSYISYLPFGILWHVMARYQLLCQFIHVATELYFTVP